MFSNLVYIGLLEQPKLCQLLVLKFNNSVWQTIDFNLISSIFHRYCCLFFFWSFVKISSKHLYSQTVRGKDLKFSENVHLSPCVRCQMSCVMCHMSLVTCHMSYVMCHVSHVTCHDKWEELVGGVFANYKFGQLFLFWSPLINEGSRKEKITFFEKVFLFSSKITKKVLPYIPLNYLKRLKKTNPVIQQFVWY